jgi:hypothetical protein
MNRVEFRTTRFVVACSVAVLSVFASQGAALAACDTLAPTFVSATLSKPTANTTNGPDTVTCTMRWTDDLSGLDSASCTIAAPTPSGAYQQQFASCSALAPTSGTRLDGTWSCPITLPRYSQAGTWTLFTASAQDLVGNNGSGFPAPTTLVVTSNQDIVAPTITSFDFNPKSVNVSSADQNVTCTVVTTDALSGIGTVSCGFTADVATPTGDEHTVACGTSTPVSGNTYQCTAKLPRYAQAGNWTAAVFVVDKLNNFNATPPATPPKLVVTSSAPDVTPPNLTAFSFTPATVDPQTGAKTVECSMTFTDSPTGVLSADCSFSAPFPFFGVSEGCSATTPQPPGTPQNGTYKCTVVIPQYAPGGQWQAGVSAADFNGASTATSGFGGNNLDLTSFDLAGLGFPSILNVTCAGGGPSEANLRWNDRTTLAWDPIAGAIKYNTYRGLTSDLTDLDDDGLADGGYGACQPDANPIDTQFVDTSKPAAGRSFYYLVAYVKTFFEEGLGNSSSELPRFPTTPCP